MSYMLSLKSQGFSRLEGQMVLYRDRVSLHTDISGPIFPIETRRGPNMRKSMFDVFLPFYMPLRSFLRLVPIRSLTLFLIRTESPYTLTYRDRFFVSKQEGVQI